jgi:2-polyprenyl-3-methyl-5-hydroxy-6-metoxy-1,4-benzoquinol methylase
LTSFEALADVTQPADRSDQADRSNGWELVADEFIRDSHRSTVGVAVVRAWADALPPGAQVLDLACGPGSPRTEVLARKAFDIHAIDAAPSLVKEYRRRFPQARVACESVEKSSFFDETFDGIMAWGLMFLLSPETQRALIPRVARVLRAGGTFLFTAPWQIGTWEDLSTKRQSVSLGADAYKTLLADAGLTVRAEYDDEGDNHYYEALKPKGLSSAV